MLRLNANGTLDTIFKTGPTEGALGPSLAAAPFLPFEVVSSGRIVAGGRFTKVQNSVRPNIVQLLPDGLRDPSFVPAGGPNNEVNALAVQPDGGILIAGPFTAVDGVARRGLARLHGNPSPPLLLASTTTPIGELADGLQATLEVKVIGNPPPQVTWYRGDIEVGTGAVLTLPKTDPANQGEYYAVVANGSGIIATDPVTLAFNTGPPVINGAPQDSLACLGGTAVFRVSATGAVPLSYQWKRNGEDLPGETGAVLRVLVGTLDPGKDSYTVAVSNPLAAVESAPVRIVLSQQGTLDRCFYEYTLPAGINDAFKECMPPTTFDFPSYEAVESIAWQPNGHVVIGGGAFTHGSQWSPRTRPFLMRFTEWGVRAYTGEERPDAAVHVVAAAPDSAVYLAGDFKHIVDEAGAPRHAQRWVAKFDANLRFVPGFAPALLPETAQVTALLVQPDGKLLMAGTFSNVNGRASLGIARLLPSGQSDPAFRSGIVFMNYAKPLALALQADGSILLGGQGAYYGAGTPPGGEYRNQLCRLNPDGSWDPTFETAGGAANAGYAENVHSIVVQPDQRILIAGLLARWGNVPRSQLARLHPDGELDLSFDAGTGPEGNANALGLSPDGRVYVGGFFQKFNGLTAAALVRLKPDGSMDEGYRAPRMNGVRALAILPDGSAIVGGSFRSGPIQPPLGDPTVTTREWRHPGTGSIHNLESITWESQCPEHGPEHGQVPWLDNFCGMSFTALNGVMRLRGADFALEAPRIVVQPRGTVTLTEDSVHTLFVGVQSDLPEGVALAYQWSKDGVDIPGATKPLLWLDPVTRARAGKYAVRVSSDWGTLVSEPAVVQVAPGTGPRGELALRPELKRFEWRFNPAPGRQFTPEDAAGLQLEVSDDLKAWTRVPGGVLIENGVLVFREDQSEFKARRFYRLAAIASLPPPAAQTDPAAQISLADVPQAVRALAQEHIQAFIGDARSRTAEERNWENVTFADEARLLFDPGHAQGGEPTYVELRVVSALNPADARGYVVLALTDDDFPIVEFATLGPTKTDRLLQRAGQGVVKRFLRFTPGYLVGEDPGGQRLVSLGTMPQRVVGDLPEGGNLRTAHFNSETGVRTVPPRSQMNLVPFASYEELRQDFIANPMRQALRAQRRQETTARWNLARNQRQPVLRLTPGEITDALAGEPVTQARADGDEDEEPVVTVSVLRNGGIRLTALREGSQLLRVRLEDGRVAHHTVVVTTSARLSPTLHGGECAHIRERNWYAGQGWHVDQCQYDQLHRDEWCPAVGCGPTALAMLLGWWDVHGVPSAFYRLRSGAGSTGAFRFEFPSVYGPDAPLNADDDTKEALLADVYRDLHGLCNVMCNPFGDGGATYPDQMESAFWEYMARVAYLLPPPMNEYGDGFVGVTADASWVPPGGLTDWEGGGKFVANGIKKGRPGIVGIGLCLCDPPHYGLAYGYKRIDVIVGCDDPEVVETRRFFKLNMGHGPTNPPEWHVAENVWFGLTANLWQKKLPKFALPGNPGDFLGNAFGLGAKYEVTRPAAAMTPLAQRLVLLEGDNHGNVPTPFMRMTSVNGGASYTTPLIAGIGQGLFRSGPAVVMSADGQRLHAFGLGTDQRLWRASSTDGGKTWPNAWGPFGPVRVYSSAPAAAASADGTHIYIVAMGADDAYHTFASRDGGQTWPVLSTPLGGAFKSAPAVTTSFFGDAVHVVGLGTDQRFWHAYSFNSGTNWAGWWPVGGGAFNAAPAAVMSADGGILRVFGRGLDYGFHQAVSTDDSVTWSPWTAVVPGAIFSSGPAATLEADGQRIRLFGRGWPSQVAEGTIPDPAQPRLWQAFSPDGGANWPGNFTGILPSVEAGNGVRSILLTNEASPRKLRPWRGR